MEILRRVIKKSLIIILPAAVASAFIEGKKLPLGIVAGGVLGILNLRGLVRNVQGVIGSKHATAKIVFLSMFRLLGLFVAIFILIWFKIINVLGLLFGFTVVFVLILYEGMKVGKER